MSSILRNDFSDEIISVMFCLPLRPRVRGQAFAPGTLVPAKSTKKCPDDKELFRTGLKRVNLCQGRSVQGHDERGRSSCFIAFRFTCRNSIVLSS
jgi:hypothetical protein